MQTLQFLSLLHRDLHLSATEKSHWLCPIHSNRPTYSNLWLLGPRFPKGHIDKNWGREARWYSMMCWSLREFTVYVRLTHIPGPQQVGGQTTRRHWQINVKCRILCSRCSLCLCYQLQQLGSGEGSHSAGLSTTAPNDNISDYWIICWEILSRMNLSDHLTFPAGPPVGQHFGLSSSVRLHQQDGLAQMKNICGCAGIKKKWAYQTSVVCSSSLPEANSSRLRYSQLASSTQILIFEPSTSSYCTFWAI